MRIGQNLTMKILLAENDELIKSIMLMMLKKLGYHADVAASGIEVLASLEHTFYNIVLMDIHMPKMDSLGAARIICQNRPNGLRIIAVTACAQEENREKCLNAGMDDYVCKPITIRELAILLNKHESIMHEFKKCG